jgi:uncharacterized protein (UPF0262 family)
MKLIANFHNKMMISI